MKLALCIATLLMCGAAAAKEPDKREDPELLSDSSDIFELMLQRGCSVATDGCTIYRQKVFAGIPYRQQALSYCSGVPRRFVCQQ